MACQVSTSALLNFSLHHDAWGRLVLTDHEGRAHVGVEPVRAFPLSDAQHWISICDTTGRELECIKDTALLPAEVRGVLEEDLSRREFVPVIRRITHIASNVEPAQWEVETDRGSTRFQVHSGEDVRRLGNHDFMVVDVRGIRYLIPDSRQLDTRSRRLLERYL